MSKGTWQGSGTFQTDGGPDPAVVLAVLIGVLLIGGSGAALISAISSVLVIAAIVIGVLVVAGAAALVLLWRATRRREARYAVSERHQRIMATVAEITAEPQVTQRVPLPAVEQHVHHHYYGADAQPAFRVVRAEVER